VLNTSFNLAGEPIVTRAVEGYSTFRRCGIDLLVAGRYVVGKRSAARERSNDAPAIAAVGGGAIMEEGVTC
jgi:carbamoyltransferase